MITLKKPSVQVDGHMDTTLNDLEGDVSRRDFIYLATTAFAAIGAAGALWPAIDQMNADASALSLGSTEVDLSPVGVGQAITVLWRGKPIFIRHRTAEEIKKAQDVPLSDLKDPYAQVSGAPSDLQATVCPCHGSMYDTAGRIRQGPAPRNLDIPPYEFTGDAKIRIGIRIG